MSEMNIEKYYTSREHLLKVFERESRKLGLLAKNINEYDKWKIIVRQKLIKLTGLNKMETCSGGIRLTIIAGCVLLDNNKVLMVQEGKDGIQELWNFPSGRLECNEGIINAATREVEEETGYKISVSGLLGIYNFLSVTNDQVIMFCYVGQVVDGSIKYDNNEITNVKWLSIDEIAKLSDDKLRSYRLIRKIVNDLKNKDILSLDIINDMI